MGLLDKAERLRLQPQHSPSPGGAAVAPPRGLRARAESFRAGTAARVAAGGAALGRQVQRLGRGLLARAESFRSGPAEGRATPAPLEVSERESLGAAVGGGLLARAEKARSEGTAVAPSEPDRGPAGVPDLMDLPDSWEPPASSAEDIVLAGPETPAGETGPITEEGLSAEGVTPGGPAKAVGGPPTEEWPELPTLEDLELEREETRAPAAEEVVLTDESGADPFAAWQEEAQRAAAAAASKLAAEKPSAPETTKPDRYLFADDEFSTRPVETHIAGQRKIDNYLALFDITKELAATDSVAALWETILYGVMGQVGAETICIFSTMKERNGRRLYPVAHSGFEMRESWSLGPGDVIYDGCRSGDGVRYAEEFAQGDASRLSEVEQSILNDTSARLVVPLKNHGHMYGVIFLGSQLSGDDYSVDDMEFLTLLGETAAVGVDRALARREFEQNTEQLRKRSERQGRIFDVAREAASVKNLDELYDLTAQHLRDDFGIKSFSVVLLSPRAQEYRLFGGNEISPASIAKFRLPVNSELIGLISNLIRVYELPDFRENKELASCYTNDDLALMESYWVIPLISLNWLVGFITVHGTSAAWTEFDRELAVAAAEMLGPVFANAVILGERETLFRDPFSPLEGRLKLEVKKAREFQTNVSLVEVRVKNIKRLMASNTAEGVADFLSELGRATSGFLFESDFLARVGQGRFALVLPGRSGPEADIFVRKLKSEFKRRRFLAGSPVDIQYASSIITFPNDAEDAGKMLAMLD